jgi:hypothetical protein
MADLPFLDKLNENQLKVADKIITRAEKMGVDPRLALSVAYVESGFNMGKTGEAGEIGIMQVKPSTGKMLGFDAKALRNEDSNIDAGLTYLKQGIDRYKDPMLGVVAYNAGHDAPFLLGKAKEPPATTIQYVNKINAVGGFATPTEAAATEAAPVAAPEAVSAPNIVSDIVRLSQASAAHPVPEAVTDTTAAGGVGALGGAAIGSGTKTLAQRSAEASARAGTPVQNWAQAMGYGDRGAETYKQAHQFEQGTRKGASIRSAATGQTFKPEFRVPKPPVIEPPSTAGQKVLGTLESAGKAMSKVPVVSGALAGYGAGSQGIEAAQRWNRGDVPGAIISGIGAAGSVASMVPHPLTRAIGAATATVSPAALWVLDKMRQQEQGALPAQQTAP